MKLQEQPTFLFLKTSQFKVFFILHVIVSMSLFSSCRLSEFTSILFAAQAWSQNYALIEGVTCSAREMIDGDIKTVGSSGHQIRINLPERKTVHRLVFRQTNIQNLTLYIDRNNDDENVDLAGDTPTETWVPYVLILSEFPSPEPYVFLIKIKRW